MAEGAATEHRDHQDHSVGARKSWLLVGGGFAIIVLWFLFAVATPSVRVVSIGPSRVKPRIAVSGDRVLLLAPDGSLWTWAEGTKPRRLGTESDWQAIALSLSDCVGLKTNGTLWQWQKTPGGSPIALSQLSPASHWQAVTADNLGFAALRDDGTLWTWRGTPVQFDDSTNWVSIAGGYGHTAAVSRDGTLWVWGQFYSGQPIGATQFGNDTNWMAVYGATYELMARKRDGSCWMGGSSTPWLTNLLALQRPLQWGEMAPIKEIEDWDSFAFGSCALGLRSDGTLHGFGVNWAGILGSGPFRVRKGPVQITARRDWVAVGASGWVAAGLTADGTVWAWGKRVDRRSLLAQVKQNAAQWLRPLGITLNTAATDLTSPRPMPILQFRSREGG